MTGLAVLAGAAMSVAWTLLLVPQTADPLRNWFSPCGWKADAVSQLDHLWEQHVFGQEIGHHIVHSAVNKHLSDPAPKKALLLSLHGPTQVGKSFTVKLMGQAITDSSHIHVISPINYMGRDEASIHESRTKINEIIESALARCKYSVFIFEEAHMLPPGVLNVLTEYAEKGKNAVGVKKVDATRAIFALTLNSGQGVINLMAKRIAEQSPGVFPRARIKELMEDTMKLQKLLVEWAKTSKEEHTLSGSKLLEKNIIDHFVPYTPLTHEHVCKCIEVEMVAARERGLRHKKFSYMQWEPLVVERIANESVFEGIFARDGCAPGMVDAQVNLQVEGLLDKMNTRDEDGNFLFNDKVVYVVLSGQNSIEIELV